MSFLCSTIAWQYSSSNCITMTVYFPIMLVCFFCPSQNAWECLVVLLHYIYHIILDSNMLNKLIPVFQSMFFFLSNLTVCFCNSIMLNSMFCPITWYARPVYWLSHYAEQYVCPIMPEQSVYCLSHYARKVFYSVPLSQT